MSYAGTTITPKNISGTKFSLASGNYCNKNHFESLDTICYINIDTNKIN